MNKFSRLTRHLETCANVAIIAVAVLVAVVFAKSYILADHGKPQPQNLVGTKISVPGVNWKQNGQTVVLLLQKGCRFCTESAPFYQQIVKETAASGNIRLIALLPQEVDEGRRYLSELGVAIDEVRQVAPGSLGVRGTPTLLLVNSEGEVAGVWRGKLSVEGEAEVLAKLRQCGASQRCG
jgi:hypothetical protein